MSATVRRSGRALTNWRLTIAKRVPNLAELACESVAKAIESGDRAVSALVFKLLYEKSRAWRPRHRFSHDPEQARMQMEEKFAKGELSPDELSVLIRSRDLQLRIREQGTLKDQLAAMEEKLNQLVAKQGGHDET